MRCSLFGGKKNRTERDQQSHPVRGVRDSGQPINQRAPRNGDYNITERQWLWMAGSKLNR